MCLFSLCNVFLILALTLYGFLEGWHLAILGCNIRSWERIKHLFIKNRKLNGCVFIKKHPHQLIKDSSPWILISQIHCLFHNWSISRLKIKTNHKRERNDDIVNRSLKINGIQIVHTELSQKVNLNLFNQLTIYRASWSYLICIRQLGSVSFWHTNHLDQPGRKKERIRFN